MAMFDETKPVHNAASQHGDELGAQAALRKSSPKLQNKSTLPHPQQIFLG